MRSAPQKIALGGILAALAIVVMTMGGLIPVATYICPMLCILLQFFVRKLCGKRIAWAWYGAVSLLSLLLSPDKEAAAVFLSLGYYPIVKPVLDQWKLGWLLKYLLFNAVILLLYWMLMHIIGLGQLVSEFSELGVAGTVITLLLGNLCFFLTDRVLEILHRRFKAQRK